MIPESLATALGGWGLQIFMMVLDAVTITAGIMLAVFIILLFKIGK